MPCQTDAHSRYSRPAAFVVRNNRLALALLFWLAIGCSLFNGPEMQQLRVTNAGSQPLLALRVLFPDTMISYGDVAAGTTSGYVDVPGGVYEYSAFIFAYNGSEVTQRVEDFVGEIPMKGRRFTYVLEFAVIGSEPGILIKSVTKDR